jgi:hypothetical protein
MERLETAAEGPGHHVDRFTRRAAVLVAMLAGLLAVATLLSNEAVKESMAPTPARSSSRARRASRGS